MFNEPQVGVLKCNVTLTQEAEETLSPSTASRSQKVSTSLPLAEMKLEVETVVVRLHIICIFYLKMVSR